MMQVEAQFPGAGDPGRKAETPELVSTGLPFLAVYPVREDAVEIHRTLYIAQNWP
jgi:toxin ParE1/3/4